MKKSCCGITDNSKEVVDSLFDKTTIQGIIKAPEINKKSRKRADIGSVNHIQELIDAPDINNKSGRPTILRYAKNNKIKELYDITQSLVSRH